MDRLFKLLQWAPACALAALAFHPGAQAEPWQKVADQYQFFDVDKAGDYRFGVGDRWAVRSLTPGKYYCFLQPDPAPGVFKTCEADLTGGASPITPLPPPSVTYHYSDCAPGADARCVPGDDANDGLSADKPRRKVQALDFSTLPAGARIALAKGGAWTTDQYVYLDNHNATNERRITMAAYTPPWGGAAKPRYTYTGAKKDANDTKASAFIFRCGYDTPVCGNMVFDGIEFVGTQPSSSLFSTWWVVANLTWQNTHMSGAGMGVVVSNNQNAAAHSRNIRLVGNHISRMHAMGVMIGADDLLIENNTFLDNALSTSDKDHHIYLSCKPTRSESGACLRNTVRNNLVEDKSFAGGGVMVVVHDLYRGLLIEGNTLRNTFPGGATSKVYGISLSEGNFEGNIEGCIDCTVQGNTLVDTGQTGIDLSQVRNARALRNTIVFTRPAEVQCFRIGLDPGTSASIALDKVEVSQNTCYIAKPLDSSLGVWVRNRSTEGGYNHRIANNLFYMGPTVQDKAWRATSFCYNVEIPANRFVDSSNNACFGADATSGHTTGTAYNWNSVTANPLIAAVPTAANPAVKLQPGSPAQGKGAP